MPTVSLSLLRKRGEGTRLDHFMRLSDGNGMPLPLSGVGYSSAVCDAESSAIHVSIFGYASVHKRMHYELRANKSGSHLTKLIVNTIYVYGSKIICYKNTFRYNIMIFI